MSGIGHNGPPKPFSKRRWAIALFAHPKKPYGAIAMGFKIFIEMDGQGRGASISDEEFRACCGVSDGSCRNFKRWLINHRFIRIQVRGQRGRTSIFQGVIPGEIPADIAAIDETIPATNTGKNEEYRQPLPANSELLAATNAGNQPIQAAHAANTDGASRACIETPSELLLNLEDTTPPKGSPSKKFKATKADAQACFDKYNLVAHRLGLPKSRTMTPDRESKIKTRLDDHGSVEAWDIALGNLEKSKHCQGGNDRGWRASLGFMCQPKSFDNLVDGSYGNGAFATQYAKTGMNDGLEDLSKELAKARNVAGDVREKP